MVTFAASITGSRALWPLDQVIVSIQTIRGPALDDGFGVPDGLDMSSVPLSIMRARVVINSSSRPAEQMEARDSRTTSHVPGPGECMALLRTCDDPAGSADCGVWMRWFRKVGWSANLAQGALLYSLCAGLSPGLLMLTIGSIHDDWRFSGFLGPGHAH